MDQKRAVCLEAFNVVSQYLSSDSGLRIPLVAAEHVQWDIGSKSKRGIYLEAYRNRPPKVLTNCGDSNVVICLEAVIVTQRGLSVHGGPHVPMMTPRLVSRMLII